MAHKIKARGVIMRENKIFLLREINKHFYYLPGGTIEPGENIKQGLKRELLEELGIEIQIGKLISVREFQNEKEVMLDFWFEIKNSKDFLNIDKKNTSHAFEYYDEGFYDINSLKSLDIKPRNMIEIIQNNEINIFL